MTPIMKPAIARRKLNHMPDTTAASTVRPFPRTSGSAKRRKTFHRWGIDASSVLMGMRQPKTVESGPPSAFTPCQATTKSATPTKPSVASRIRLFMMLPGRRR